MWGLCSIVGAFVPLLILNFLQFPSLLLLPFSRRLYQQYNRMIAALIWGWWAWGIQNIVGVRINITGDPRPAGEDAMVIANHQSMSDIVAILCLALTQKRIGDVKWMVKDVVKFLPGIGWGMIFLGCIFVKRDWMRDEGTIRNALRRYTVGKIPFWLASFPEGTRLTPEKLAKSNAYAQSAGLKETKHVLLPRPNGFVASVAGLRNHIVAIYSVTIGYPGNVIPSLAAFIRGEVEYVNIHFRRYPIASFPQDEKAQVAWLVAQFYEKDAWLSG